VSLIVPWKALGVDGKLAAITKEVRNKSINMVISDFFILFFYLFGL